MVARNVSYWINDMHSLKTLYSIFKLMIGFKIFFKQKVTCKYLLDRHVSLISVGGEGEVIGGDDDVRVVYELKAGVVHQAHLKRHYGYTQDARTTGLDAVRYL